MIGAVVGMQVLLILLTVILAVIAVAIIRGISGRLRGDIARLRDQLGELDARAAAQASEIAALQSRLLPAPAPTAAPPSPLHPAALGPELVALLTAAAYAVIGKPVVLHYALLLDEDQGASWRAAGRQDIFSSHRFR